MDKLKTLTSAYEYADQEIGLIHDHIILGDGLKEGLLQKSSLEPGEKKRLKYLCNRN